MVVADGFVGKAALLQTGEIELTISHRDILCLTAPEVIRLQVGDGIAVAAAGTLPRVGAQPHVGRPPSGQGGAPPGGGQPPRRARLGAGGPSPWGGAPGGAAARGPRPPRSRPPGAGFRPVGRAAAGPARGVWVGFPPFFYFFFFLPPLGLAFPPSHILRIFG